MSQFSRALSKIISLPVYVYKYAISPLLPPRCRFTPTCSEYTLEALQRHGPLKGSLLSAKRLAKCHPFCKSCGLDPVPPVRSKCKKSPEKML